jgi:hypothetical protein
MNAILGKSAAEEKLDLRSCPTFSITEEDLIKVSGSYFAGGQVIATVS